MVHFKDVEKQAVPEMLMPPTWEQVKRGLTSGAGTGGAGGLER